MKWFHCAVMAGIVAGPCMAGSTGAQASPSFTIGPATKRGTTYFVTNPDNVDYGRCILHIQFIEGWFTPQATSYHFPLPRNSSRAVRTYPEHHYNVSVAPTADLSCKQ